jgi:hypothetical protein
MWNVILLVFKAFWLYLAIWLVFKAFWLYLAIWHAEINITAALRKDVEVSDHNLSFGAAAIAVFIVLQWMI